MQPGLWPIEVANALLVAVRRQRIGEAQLAAFSELLQTLPMTVEDPVLTRALGPVLQLARAQGLSAYDASYLELAMRQASPLATLDARLAQVARQLGVSVI